MGWEQSGTYQHVWMTQLENRRPPEYNSETKEHFWIVTVAHRFNPQIETPRLDLETMVIPPAVGCWHCEKQYDPSLLNTPCPGDPFPFEE